MAVLKIESVKLETIGELTAWIDGIELCDHDLFIGTIQMKGDIGPRKARWNRSGTMRDGSDSTNIPASALEDLVKTASKLNARGAS
jgi:hypothetical protein